MALSTQAKNDKAGGFMIVQVSNGQQAHKMRFHVPEFGNTPGVLNATIPHDYTYVASPSGHELSVGETFYEVAVCLRGMYHSSWTFTLAALYRNTAAGSRYDAPGPGGGELVPVHPIPRPIGVVGTSGNNNDWPVGEVTLYLPTVDGGRYTLRMIGSQEWDPTDRKRTIQPIAGGGSGSTSITITTAYLEGQPSGVSASGNPGLFASSFTYGSNPAYTTGTARSMIIGHDGSNLIGPAVLTNCMNKRVRRSLRLI